MNKKRLRLKFLLPVAFVGVLAVFYFVQPTLAVTLEEATAGGEKNIKLVDLIDALYGIISTVTLIASVIAGLIGSYMYMSSGGDPKKITVAKDIIVRAAIGMLVVALAYTFFKSLV